jgi:hypothetical protein
MRKIPFSRAVWRSNGWCALVLILLFCGPAAQAQLYCEQANARAGVVRTGAPLAARFGFVNRGTEPLEITEVRVSCGCLKPQLAQRTYQPGEEGSLLLEVNTLSHSSGLHTWTVKLLYRCGNAEHELPLQLTGEVVTEISVQPAGLILFVDRAVGHEVVLTDHRDRPLSVVDLRTSTPHLHSRLVEKTQDEQGHTIYRFELVVGEAFPEGRFEEALALYTDDPAYREIKVPVLVLKRNRQQLAATPSEVNLQVPPGQAIPSRIVLLRDPENRGVAVESILADDPAISSLWAPGPNNMATLRIKVDRALLQGNSLQSAVHVQISKPVRETLTIPVTCTLE